MDSFRERRLAPQLIAGAFHEWRARILLHRRLQQMRQRVIQRRTGGEMAFCFDAWNVVVDEACDLEDRELREAHANDRERNLAAREAEIGKQITTSLALAEATSKQLLDLSDATNMQRAELAEEMDAQRLALADERERAVKDAEEASAAGIVKEREIAAQVEAAEIEIAKPSTLNPQP
ncbi:hypothetical protein T484DRAFT_1767099 [Baffinella frigidus]|nr:hypothetical protein T484DRAFT_1767099 [Cryptophyta sp. CCMP2293]